MRNSRTDPNPVFPISVKFDSGSVESFGSVDSLETDLEVFDSDASPGCEVRDALGRRVRLRIDDQLILRELSLAVDPNVSDLR
ncbi:MAG: hypothetical protein QOE77_1594 [Blastocatellia bacterium]|jgi:hypothetical protein|nr:hypothetical protein [Blastocatellia bacterium]